jgi:hypothetical protein
MHITDTINKNLTKNQQYLIHIRDVLASYQLDEEDPPEWLLDELKLAERLVRMESKEFAKFRQQFEI